MTRTLVSAALLLALPAAVSAQPRARVGVSGIAGIQPTPPASVGNLNLIGNLIGPGSPLNGVWRDGYRSGRLPPHVGDSGLVDTFADSYPPVGTANIIGGLVPSVLYVPDLAVVDAWRYKYGYSGWFPILGHRYRYYSREYDVLPPEVVPVRDPRDETNRQARAVPPAFAPANELPATLVLEFPPAAEEMRVSGEPAAQFVAFRPGAVEVRATEKQGEWNLTSPTLRAGGEYTFEVKARWVSGGKTYEYARSVKVAGGQRSKVLVVAGTEVKE